MTAPSATVSRVLPAGPEAAAQARHHLRHTDLGLDAPTLTDLTLLVSEAVTNAVRHAGLDPGDPIDLSVRVTAERVHVRIAHRGDPPPAPGEMNKPPERGAAGGWGLVIIDRIAERWGVEERPAGMWFELRRRAGG
jgi:anti-sigma regulatory factor (Ser/Thr protein kinase)